MDEIQYTQFQIKPTEANAYRRRVMFKNEVFDLEDVNRITSVATVAGINFFTFDVYVAPVKGSAFTLTFSSPTKAEALRWQRELSRAWCEVGEFGYEEKVK